MKIKSKVNKWDLIKLNRFCTANCSKVEKTTLRMGENNSKWNNWQRINIQNIKAANTTQCQKNKEPNQKVGKRPKQIFLKRDIQMANKHMKKCSTSLIIREMQIKTTMRYHFTSVRISSVAQLCLTLCNPMDCNMPGLPVRMAIIKKSTNNKCWRRCWEKGKLLHCWWECKLI